MSGSGTGTPAVDGDALFTVAEARAFDKLQLASVTNYPAATIIAKEAEIREFLIRACGVDFFPTTHADEYHNGDQRGEMLLDWPLVTEVTASSTRSGTTWTPLTADNLAQIQVDPKGTGEICWEYGSWPRGRSGVKVTYTAGYDAVPALIKAAALSLCVNELPASNVPWEADGYDAGGTSYSWTRGDGFNGNWSSLPIVQRAIRMYDHSLPGIA